MRVLIASEDKSLGEYIKAQGHETKTVFVNDVVLQAARLFSAEVVVYFTSVIATEVHEDVIKSLCSEGMRVILASERDDPVRAYAAALGVTDLLELPVEPAEVLHRLKNPASKEEAAEAMKQAVLAPRTAEEKDRPAAARPLKALFRRRQREAAQAEGGQPGAPAEAPLGPARQPGYSSGPPVCCQRRWPPCAFREGAPVKPAVQCSSLSHSPRRMQVTNTGLHPTAALKTRRVLSGRTVLPFQRSLMTVDPAFRERSGPLKRQPTPTPSPAAAPGVWSALSSLKGTTPWSS